jgi:hypothetical protein
LSIHVDDSTTIPTAAAIEFAVLVLSLTGIKRACAQGESRLARLLRTQGVAYFVIVFFIQISTIASDFASLENIVR